MTEKQLSVCCRLFREMKKLSHFLLPVIISSSCDLNEIFNHYRSTSQYSTTSLNRTLVIRIANYPDRLGPSGKFVENSTKQTCLEITGYRINYSTAQCFVFYNLKSVVVEGLDAGKSKGKAIS